MYYKNQASAEAAPKNDHEIFHQQYASIAGQFLKQLPQGSAAYTKAYALFSSYLKYNHSLHVLLADAEHFTSDICSLLEINNIEPTPNLRAGLLRIEQFLQKLKVTGHPQSLEIPDSLTGEVFKIIRQQPLSLQESKLINQLILSKSAAAKIQASDFKELFFVQKTAEAGSYATIRQMRDIYNLSTELFCNITDKETPQQTKTTFSLQRQLLRFFSGEISFDSTHLYIKISLADALYRFEKTYTDTVDTIANTQKKVFQLLNETTITSENQMRVRAALPQVFDQDLGTAIALTSSIVKGLNQQDSAIAAQIIAHLKTLQDARTMLNKVLSGYTQYIVNDKFRKLLGADILEQIIIMVSLHSDFATTTSLIQELIVVMKESECIRVEEWQHLYGVICNTLITRYGDSWKKAPDSRSQKTVYDKYCHRIIRLGKGFRDILNEVINKNNLIPLPLIAASIYMYNALLQRIFAPEQRQVFSMENLRTLNDNSSLNLHSFIVFNQEYVRTADGPVSKLTPKKEVFARLGKIFGKPADEMIDYCLDTKTVADNLSAWLSK